MKARAQPVARVAFSVRPLPLMEYTGQDNNGHGAGRFTAVGRQEQSGSVTPTYELVERFRGGDEAAFEPLFRKYRPRLAVLAHYRMGPELKQYVDVEDILQEVFLAAATSLDRFQYRSPGSFLRWLAGIMESVIRDAARFHGRQKRRPREMLRFRSASNPQGPDPASSTTPSRILARKEAIRELMARLDPLPEQYRLVILLAKFEGLSTAEIAERLGKRRQAVALLLHRALRRLRQREADD